MDLYRTKTFREVKALGITEIWGKPNVVTVIEWADKIKAHLPKKTIHINFSHG
jgi:tRNA A37 threonylcarbamoyladenosine biosynthesis protein TsaE